MPKSTLLKLFAGTAVAALMIGGTASAGVPTSDSSASSEQAPLSPSIPLGQDNTREVQNQLIALGFDPGPADGQIGPATVSAAQQYDLSRGGTGEVSIDGPFLARLKQDDAPRLTYDQVAARSQARQPVQTSQAQASGGASSSSQFGAIVQQIAPIVGAAIANSNNSGPAYYGPGPGYYGPGPGYYGRGYGYGGY